MMVQKIDSEVCWLIDEVYVDVKCILMENYDGFVVCVEGLLEYEMLMGDEIKQLLKGEKFLCDFGDDMLLSCGLVVFFMGVCNELKFKLDEGFELQL